MIQLDCGNPNCPACNPKRDVKLHVEPFPHVWKKHVAEHRKKEIERALKLGRNLIDELLNDKYDFYAAETKLHKFKEALDKLGV